MSVHPVEFQIAVQVIQCMGALILAALLRHYFVSFGHRFLCHWARSSMALAVYLAGSAGALLVTRAAPELGGLRLGLTIVSLGAAYPHVVWLMVGTWEAAKLRSVPGRQVWWMVGFAAVFGVATAVMAPFDPAQLELRGMLRFDIRHLLTGLAFGVAGILLWRAQRSAGFLGARIGAIGFILLGVQMLHIAALDLWLAAGGDPPFYFGYAGLLEFLFLSLIALGIVMWLLEMQQQSAFRAHTELAFARSHDRTTGLPNRERMLEQIEEMMQRTGAARVAVITLGVNRYSMLCRSLGWSRVEQIMGRIAGRLHEVISGRCALGRISDRDFVIVRPTLDEPERIREWTENLLGGIVEPVDVGGQEIFVTFCGGVSVYPDDARHPELLLQHSQQALVRSAEIGRDVTMYESLDRSEGTAAGDTLRLEAELRRALEQRQFELHYQPIASVADLRVIGFEALLRWQHPERGLLRPDAFLDAAAGIGMLDQLETFVLDSALAQLAKWNAETHSGMSIAVNLSARRFQHDALVDEIVARCREHGLAAGELELEITENTALRDLGSAADKIRRLREAGVGVALDDFGTGYSSLANLLKLPVSRIKLDREFLDGMEHSERQRELVVSMIELGHRLGIDVVAEGVEHPGQLEFLARHRCDFVQGHLLHRPAPADDCRFELRLDIA